MASRSAWIRSGICVPQSFVTRRKDAYAWIGIIPGITGTVMPNTRGEYRKYAPITSSQTAGADLPYPSKEVVDVIKQLCYNKVGAGVNLCF